MKRFALVIASFLLSTSLGAETVSLSKFSLLNNNQPSVVIDPSEAQDLLNVDVTPQGKSVKKRSGYGSYKALSTGQAVHGGAHFFDSTGNDVQVWGSSTSLYGIVSDGTPTQLISSATLNATWDCADNQGTAYCVNTSRDALIATSGATKTWYTTPLGTMITSLPDRLVVAGVSGSPGTLYFSQSGVFTNFTTGINTSDPFTEVIAAPGSKITHIRTGCGKLLWWKDQSFGYLQGSDQFSIVPTIVSDSIGTFDNTSDVDPGGRVWFRGQDGHIWMYDCSGLQKMSIPITPNIQTSGKRVSNSWTQTSQSDWQSGSAPIGSSVSFTSSAGDVVPSSYTVTENTTTGQWSNGIANSLSVGTSSITLVINNSGNIANNSFETSASPIALWTVSTTGTELTPSRQTVTTFGAGCASGFPGFDSGAMLKHTYTSTVSDAWSASLHKNSDASTIATLTLDPSTAHCNASVPQWSTGTVTAPSANLGQRVYFTFDSSDANGSAQTKSSVFVLGGNMTFNYTNDLSGDLYMDRVLNGSSTITSGSFSSQVFDTGFTSATYQLQSAWSANTSTPTFALQVSTSSTGPWTTLLTSTGTNGIGNRYAKYTSTISISSSDNALTTISSVTVIAVSSASYYSTVKNSTNLTQWSTFNPNAQNNGGTHSYFARSSTNSFTTLSSTPAWVAQTAGAAVSASTGTYFQIRDDFTVSAATATLPALNDFTLNWYEGTATDQAYMLYFDNAIWSTVAFGSGQSTNNYVFKYDLINEGWTLYNFGAGGLLVQSNALYFGDTSAGNIFKFGTGTSDNGSSIRAYWRSKSFTGQDPWNQNQYTQLDTYWTRNTNQVSSATYTLDGQSSGTAYTISLSSSTKSIISNMKLLPNGKIGQLFDVQVGDTSDSSQWEFLGFRMTFTPLPYRPTQ